MPDIVMLANVHKRRNETNMSQNICQETSIENNLIF